MAGITIPLITEFKDTGIKQAIKQFKSLETAGEKAQFAIKKAAVPAAAALAGVVTVIAGAVSAAIEDQAAQASLARQIKASTDATDLQVASVERYISSLGQSVAVSDDEARPALQALVVATKDVMKAQELLNIAIDISAATGKDLTSVSDALAKAYKGNMKGLKALSPELKKMIDDGADLEDVLATLKTNFGGAGEAAANTAAGGMKKLGIAFNETKESIGMAFLPILQKLLPVVQKFSAWAERNPTLLAVVIASMGILAISILAVNAAMMLNPAILITAAIIALGVAIFAAYKKFEGFRKIVDTIFNFIKNNWPLLLAILTGPFGLAVYAIMKFKDSIIGFLQGIKDFAVTIFDGIIGAYRTVMNGVLGLMESGINKAISGLNAALNVVDAAAGPLVNFGSIPNINIPRLAEGGIVTGPTLAMIGEGNGPEAVIPLDRMGSMGNNITINVQGADPNAVVQALQRYVRTSGPVPVNIRNM